MRDPGRASAGRAALSRPGVRGDDLRRGADDGAALPDDRVLQRRLFAVFPGRLPEGRGAHGHGALPCLRAVQFHRLLHQDQRGFLARGAHARPRPFLRAAGRQPPPRRMACTKPVRAEPVQRAGDRRWRPGAGPAPFLSHFRGRARALSVARRSPSAQPHRRLCVQHGPRGGELRARPPPGMVARAQGIGRERRDRERFRAGDRRDRRAPL